VTNAIDGVTLNLLKLSPLGLEQGLTIGVDQAAVTTAINLVHNEFQSLGDTLDKLTASTPGQSGGRRPNVGTAGIWDPTIDSLFLSLRGDPFRILGKRLVTRRSAPSGSIPVPSDRWPARPDRLQLDTDKLTNSPQHRRRSVASLLDGSTGPLSALLTKAQEHRGSGQHEVLRPVANWSASAVR